VCSNLVALVSINYWNKFSLLVLRLDWRSSLIALYKSLLKRTHGTTATNWYMYAGDSRCPVTFSPQPPEHPDGCAWPMSMTERAAVRTANRRKVVERLNENRVNITTSRSLPASLLAAPRVARLQRGNGRVQWRGGPPRVTPSRGRGDTRLKLIFCGWIYKKTLDKRRGTIMGVVGRRQLKRSPLSRGDDWKEIVSFFKEKIRWHHNH